MIKKTLYFLYYQIYEIKDHLGNVRAVVSDIKNAEDYSLSASSWKFLADVRSLSNYYPYGSLIEAGSWSGGDYNYGYNGMLKEGIGKDIYHTLNRGLFTIVPVWMKTDPLERKYPSYSPYSYVANKPIVAIDIEGEELYILFSVEGYEKKVDEVMFESAMNTRKKDIESSKDFNYKKDKVLTIKISDMSEIQYEVELEVMKYSKLYGSTREVGIFSHSAYDGPIGSVPIADPDLRVSDKPRDAYQLKPEGWEKIKYNWTNYGANITFYGCMSASEGQNFAKEISEMKNYENVQVSGQSYYCFPSFDNINRTTNVARSTTLAEFYTEGDTYMVAQRTTGWEAFLPISNPGLKFNSYINGTFIGSGYQSTTNLKSVIPTQD